VAKLVGHARNERCLRTDHDEVGIERAGEVEQALAVLRADRVTLPEARDPGIPRCGVELAETRALPQLPSKRVLAAAGADQEHPHVGASLLRSSEVSKGAKAAKGPIVVEPGLDRHDWESEWQQLEPLVRDAPAETLPELHDLIVRMLQERGILDEDLAATEGADPELLAEYVAGNDVVDRLERDEVVDPGDIASVVGGYRSLYEFLTTERSAP